VADLGGLLADGRGRRPRAGQLDELLVYGSPDLVDELLRHDLIDEYRILMFPVILLAVRDLIERWQGQNIEFTGDGVMAVFDAPTRALRCGFELAQAAGGLGVEIRVGLHTGEIERRETGVGGIAVHIAARLLSQAEANQVIVTKTVRDLATGTDLAFEHRGLASLRGVPGEWELFDSRTSER